MKKLVVMLSACLLIGLAGFTQKLAAEKVPAAVKQSFNQKYPGATNVKYEMEDNDFEISFRAEASVMSANFDKTGKWLETEKRQRGV